MVCQFDLQQNIELFHRVALPFPEGGYQLTSQNRNCPQINKSTYNVPRCNTHNDKHRNLYIYIVLFSIRLSLFSVSDNSVLLFFNIVSHSGSHTDHVPSSTIYHILFNFALHPSSNLNYLDNLSRGLPPVQHVLLVKDIRKSTGLSE